jgi:23S rRNA (cytosine1962-C5)-methyltransferase
MIDRTRIWPDIDPARILYEDDDVIAYDKPAGMLSQSASESGDDLVSRLARSLSARATDLSPVQLGVHQRLDRETSGVLLYAKRSSANAGLARQFEQRLVHKRYVAAVLDWPHDAARRTLRHRLAADGGRAEVVLRGGQVAVTHVAVARRVESRALLHLELETGRMHQARVQLAYAGAPIAGDAMYGGALAPRLLLHAAELHLSHPSTGKKLRIEAKLPLEFERWIDAGDLGGAIFDDRALLDAALARALERRFRLGRGEGDARRTDAFRLVNEGGDGLAGLAVDVYGAHLVAQIYDEPGAWPEGRRAHVLDRLAALGFSGVYLKIRPKQANTLVDTRTADVAPPAPVRGGEADDPLVVHEEGIPYEVRLGDGLSTGIFLDQRGNRRRVRELAAGRSVANLFAYTCGFSVAAAAGGAWRTVSVDASVAALERGRANMSRAGLLDSAEHSFVAEDVFSWLERAARRGERYDLVILDPPSYSTTKARRFVASSDYAELASSALAIVRPGGELLACTNHRQISAAKFRKVLFDAGRLAARPLAHVRDLPDPEDYPIGPGGSSHLKSVLVKVARVDGSSYLDTVK